MRKLRTPPKNMICNIPTSLRHYSSGQSVSLSGHIAPTLPRNSCSQFQEWRHRKQIIGLIQDKHSRLHYIHADLLNSQQSQLLSPSDSPLGFLQLPCPHFPNSSFTNHIDENRSWKLAKWGRDPGVAVLRMSSGCSKLEL